MLKLFDYKAAPNPRRARIFMAEKGVTYENIQLDMMKAEQMSADYGKINPRHTVPALVTETGQVLTENLAIASYIDELYPEPPLMGTTPAERADILQWNARIEFEGLSPAADAYRNGHSAFIGRAITGAKNYEQIPDLAERGRDRTESFFEMLNQRLKKSPFIAGDRFSFPDITAGIVVEFARWAKLYPGESLTALAAWHKQISARPSWQA